jgi:hypothetical protein
MNPNDPIRQTILRYFYDRNASATTELGGDAGVGVSLRDVQRALAKRGLSEEKVTSNLTYLVERGWIRTTQRKSVESVSRGYNFEGNPLRETSHQTHEIITIYYHISATGIEKIEGESEFRVKDRWEGININAVDSVVVTGDNNYVNLNHVNLRHELDRLKGAVKESELNAEEKLEIISDIESIEDQLVKRVPHKKVLEILWDSVDKAVTAAGFIELVYKVKPFIESVLR